MPLDIEKCYGKEYKGYGTSDPIGSACDQHTELLYDDKFCPDAGTDQQSAQFEQRHKSMEF